MHLTPNAGFVLWGRDGIQKHGLLSAAEISSLSCLTIIMMIPVGEGEEESCLGGSKSLSLAI